MRESDFETMGVQIIFTANVGRSGSHNLTSVMNRHGIDCIAEHEPPDLVLRQLGHRPLFAKRGWFGPDSGIANWGRDLQRRFIVTHEMMGRGKALQWYGGGDADKIANLVDKRLRRIRRLTKGRYRHYIESSQFFIRTFCEETAKRVPDLGIIKLNRDPLENARSLVNRQRSLYLHALPPDHPSNIFRIENPEILSAYQVFVVQWLEQELRYQRFIERFEIEKVFEIDTPALSNSHRVSELFAYFNIDHRPIDDLKPSNENQVRTSVSQQDQEEFDQILAMLPPELALRIPVLQRRDTWASAG